jgi:hypothetical protein
MAGVARVQMLATLGSVCDGRAAVAFAKRFVFDPLANGVADPSIHGELLLFRSRGLTGFGAGSVRSMAGSDSAR